MEQQAIRNKVEKTYQEEVAKIRDKVEKTYQEEIAKIRDKVENTYNWEVGKYEYPLDFNRLKEFMSNLGSVKFNMVSPGEIKINNKTIHVFHNVGNLLFSIRDDETELSTIICIYRHSNDIDDMCNKILSYVYSLPIKNIKVVECFDKRRYIILGDDAYDYTISDFICKIWRPFRSKFIEDIWPSVVDYHNPHEDKFLNVNLLEGDNHFYDGVVDISSYEHLRLEQMLKSILFKNISDLYLSPTFELDIDIDQINKGNLDGIKDVDIKCYLSRYDESYKHLKKIGDSIIYDINTNVHIRYCKIFNLYMDKNYIEVNLTHVGPVRLEWNGERTKTIEEYKKLVNFAISLSTNNLHRPIN